MSHDFTNLFNLSGRTAVVVGGGSGLGRAASVADLTALHGDAESLTASPGLNVRKRLLDINDDEFDRIIDVNLKTLIAWRAPSGR